MTPAETLHAASAALRAGGEPVNTAVANWLASEAAGCERRTAGWRRGGADLTEMTRAHYGYALDVARTVLQQGGGE